MHAYHHPEQIRTEHEWIDFFVRFANQNPDVPIGLEFIEGLWAGKLAFIAVLITIAIIVVSIVWCVKGGELQTVFTVMGFVLSGAAGEFGALLNVEGFVKRNGSVDGVSVRLAEIALVALYYQVTLPG